MRGNEMKRHVITILFLVVAIACYAIGAAGPGTAFLIVGGIAELTFWLQFSNAINRNRCCETPRQ